MKRGIESLTRRLTVLRSARSLWRAAAAAAAAGGGGPAPPGNSAPAFTSAATANAPENGSGAIYTATATDADGNPLTFSLSGGADRAAFSITAGGALSFAQPPDFEAPTDADAQQCLSRPGRGQRRHDQRDARPCRHRHQCRPRRLPHPPRRRRLRRAALSHRHSRRLGPGPRRPAGRADPNPQPRRRHGRGDALPQRLHPDRDRRRARPARPRAGARFQRHRHLLRLPDRHGGPRSDPPLPDPGRQSRPGRSGDRRHHPRFRPPGQQP